MRLTITLAAVIALVMGGWGWHTSRFETDATASGRPAPQTREPPRAETPAQPARVIAASAVPSKSFGQVVMGLGDADSEKLLAIFRQGASTGATPREKYLTATVLELCMGQVSASPLFNQPPPNLPASAALRFADSARELKQRCSGLLRVPLDDILRWRKANVGTPPGPEFGGLQLDRGREVEQYAALTINLRRLFELNDEAALAWAWRGLGDALETAAKNPNLAPGLDPVLTVNEDTWTTAIEVAKCDLGFACGPRSLRTLNYCVNTGNCADTAAEAALMWLPDRAERALAQRQGAVIAEAIRTRQYNRLGW